MVQRSKTLRFNLGAFIMTKTFALLAAIAFAAPIAAVAQPTATEFQQSYPTSTINDHQSTGTHYSTGETSNAQTQNNG